MPVSMLFCVRVWALVSLLAATHNVARAAEPAAPPIPAQVPVSLDDLFAEPGVADVAVSPSGRFLAIVARRAADDVLVIVDLTTGERNAITRMGKFDAGPLLKSHIQAVFWKTEDRLLFRVLALPRDGVSYEQLFRGAIARLGTRLYAIDRDGKSPVRMLAGNTHSAMDLALNLGEIRSMLRKDPDHILMLVDGDDGRSLFKVNVRTGAGEIAEPARQATINWWLDLDGKPIVRVEASRGSLRYFRREADEKWKKFYSVRLRELKEQEEYEPLGASNQPGKYYVLARPEGAQRFGVYLYDLQSESFGAPLAENAEYDIFTARISRDGTRVQHHCYLAHVRVCEFTDPKVNTHLKGVRKFFQDSANVYVVDTADDENTLVLYVEGPSDPPSYYYYRLEKKQIEVIGPVSEALVKRALPTASVVEWRARDGRKLMGYLTRPPGANTATRLPLIVLPHGGPELRDQLTFDNWPQYFAARGYAVFQPNFRGSAGFSREFAESGYGEWGRKMQDDISDGFKALVDQGVADPARTCIVGASYGGYAALAGATLTPDLYKCAVSIAGISDLIEFISWRKHFWGSDSEGYTYWLKAIGDPDKDEQRLRDVSPVLQIANVKVPILLIHGKDDYVVPFSQSQEMKKRLDKSGRKTELLTLMNEGHSGWSRATERRVLTAMDAFLWDNLGPGFGEQEPPIRLLNLEKKK